MSLEGIYFISEILAAIAVVVSLVYLGIQIRRSRDQSKEEATNLITQQRAAFVNQLATDGELSLIVAKGLANQERLSGAEHLRFTSYLYHVFVHLELGFRKWQKGDLDEETWNSWDEGSLWWFSCPGAQKWWKNNLAGGFTPDFKDYVNTSMDKINSDEGNYRDRLADYMGSVGKSN